MLCKVLEHPNASEDELIAIVEKYNNDDSVDGMLVQSPLPKHINENLITQTIIPHKDVDGFHDINMGKLAKGDEGFVSATPLGVMMLLEAYKIPTAGKHCVVVGRSNIVGSPMSILMARNNTPGNATVTLTHSKTQNLKEIVLQADIIIAAIGKKNFITADMVKNGAVVIDVGMNREKSEITKSGYKLFGDVDFENVARKSSFITPVPGGVGLMTIVSLLRNTLSAAKKEFYA